MRAAVVLGLVAAALAGCGERGHRAELAREPYAGVACRSGTVACDRVGLAVWLRTPAQTVEATIAGRRLTLGRPANGRDYWQGFLQPAGLVSRRLRPGRPVRVTVTADGDRPVSLRTRLHEGWG